MSKTKPLSLIVATLFPSFGIGYKNALPWRLRNEMKYFKTVTSNAPEGKLNAVIMGKNTWESIPTKFRPLPNRLNVVITRSPGKSNEHVRYFNSVEKALETLYEMDQIHRIFIMGGAQLYNYCLFNNLVSELLITEVKSTQEVAMDTFLDKEFILEHFTKSPSEELVEHLGFNPGGTQTEGDFEYEYALYKLK
jgi:dihydrofolate reductase